MTLTLNLTPAEEARLQAVAKQQGLAPEEYARRVLSQSLPELPIGLKKRSGKKNTAPSLKQILDPIERVDALIQQWQEQDGTPVATAPPTKGTMTPAQALFHQWEEEDANLTSEEVEAQNQLCADIEAHFQRLQL